MQRETMVKPTILLLAISWTISAFGQADAIIEERIDDPYSFARGKDSLVDHVLENPEIYRFQFMFTEVKTDQATPSFGQTHDFSNPNWYFYPASMVKLPIALLTLEELNRLGHSTKATIKFENDFTCGNMGFVDESRTEDVSFEKMLRKLIVVSNNTYYNSLYHFLSPKRINLNLKEKGFSKTAIYRDFTGCEMPLNLKTHGFSIQEEGSGKIGVQEMQVLELSELAENYRYDTMKLLGSKHEYRGKIVDGPFDFNYNLEYSLRDIHVTSLRLFFPDYFPDNQQWKIREEDRQFLMQSMRELPRDLGEKEFQNEKDYPDNMYKYIVHGDDNPIYDSIITYSKIGISYGFVTETAYVIDPKTNKQYVLTASIYVNANDTVNDAKYEYEEVARPFLARLGQILLEF